MDIVTVEPEDLDAETVRLSPHFVVCSNLSEIVETRPVAWILLYPKGAGHAIVSVVGNRLELSEIEFARLLSLIDEAETLARH